MQKNQKAKIAAKTEPVQNADAAQSENNVQQLVPATMESIFGSISWLMLQSPAHRYMFISDYEWLVMPALQLKQFKIIRQGNVPIAYVSWAHINEETENRIKQGAPKLASHEWNKGDRLWIIDVIAPFCNGIQILQKLQETDFKDKQVNILRPRADGKGMEAALLKDVLKDAEKLEQSKDKK